MKVFRSIPDYANRCLEASRAGVCRQTVELMVVLTMCVLLVRTFSAEAYVVPTGSMAPTLLGLHRELNCSNCKFRFVVGIEEDGHTGQAICPNCGQKGLDTTPAIECGGDRVLVQKMLFEYQRPGALGSCGFSFSWGAVAGVREARCGSARRKDPDR